MHGVPRDLDLAPFHGTVLSSIMLAENIIYFHFDTPQRHAIGVEGGWQLRDASGKILDHQVDLKDREAYRVHALLGREVTGSEIAPPKSFTLRFDSGHALQIFDDSPHYESFRIQPGDLYV